MKNNQINTADEEIHEFDPAKHSAVFYGQSYNLSKLEDEKLLVNFQNLNLK